MYSYYSHELIVRQIQSERRQPADFRVSPRATGEIDQAAVTRHYREEREAYTRARKARCRGLVVEVLDAARRLLRARIAAAG